MAQFDVYLLRDTSLLFIDLQSGAVDEYNTRLPRHWRQRIARSSRSEE